MTAHGPLVLHTVSEWRFECVGKAIGIRDAVAKLLGNLATNCLAGNNHLAAYFYFTFFSTDGYADFVGSGTAVGFLRRFARSGSAITKRPGIGSVFGSRMTDKLQGIGASADGREIKSATQPARFLYDYFLANFHEATRIFPVNGHTNGVCARLFVAVLLMLPCFSCAVAEIPHVALAMVGSCRESEGSTVLFKAEIAFDFTGFALLATNYHFFANRFLANFLRSRVNPGCSQANGVFAVFQVAALHCFCIAASTIAEGPAVGSVAEV